MNDQIYEVIVIPFASEEILSILTGYRLTSAMNVFASFITILVGLTYHHYRHYAGTFFIISSVGMFHAFLGTILAYLVVQEALGEGVPAMLWNLLHANAAKLDISLLNLAFVFLLVGYGTKIGLAPFHAWLPDAHSEGP